MDYFYMTIITRYMKRCISILSSYSHIITHIYCEIKYYTFILSFIHSFIHSFIYHHFIHFILSLGCILYLMFYSLYHLCYHDMILTSSFSSIHSGYLSNNSVTFLTSLFSTACFSS